jgi:hypothetical protein
MIEAQLLEEIRDMRRDISDIRATQAMQPTRADLQAYVLKEVFDLEIKALRETDQKQQDALDDLRKSVQSQPMRWLQIAGVVVALLCGFITLAHTFLPH